MDNSWASAITQMLKGEELMKLKPDSPKSFCA